jgi:nicotinamide mononucleotide transporter PnuC
MGLWISSIFLITVSFLIFDRANYFNLIASLVGATSLIYCAKGNPFGQVLMIVFSVLYGMISLSFKYYGEMMTYVFMTLPMAVLSLISWLKHPYKGNKSLVEVNTVTKKDVVIMAILTAIVTCLFYFTLKYFNTANLLPSTLSVTTSFMAVFLTYKRSPYFAIFYAMNDAVLIVLWTLATMEDISYISVVVCFVIVLFNDIYGFVSWRRMERKPKQPIN